MIKDYDGAFYTQAELLRRKIIDVKIDVEETKEISKRLNDLEVVFEITEDYKNGYEKIEAYYKKLKQYLPTEKYCLLAELDDLYMELLTINEEFFYKCGYIDNKNDNRFLHRLKKWLGKRFLKHKPHE